MKLNEEKCYVRITADIDKENEASKRTLLLCGFTLLDIDASRYVIDKK